MHRNKQHRYSDHLVSQGAEHRRNFQSKELGGLEIDHQFEFGRLFHGQIGRFSALEDTAKVNGGSTEQVLEV
jgi:hypothetical protein